MEFTEKEINELNTIKAIISAMQGGTDKALRRKLLDDQKQDKSTSKDYFPLDTKILNHSCPEVTLRYIGAIK